MKKLNALIALFTAAVLTSPSRAQDAAPEQKAATEAAPAKESTADKDKSDRDKNDKDKSDQDKSDKARDAVPQAVVPEKAAIQQLVGDYRILSGENSGEEVLPERLEEVTVRFTEKTITTYDGERNARFSATYRLDTQQRPWRILMTSTAKPAGAAPVQNGAAPAKSTSEGLIEIVEGRVKVIYALPGGLAPESFKTGERQQMFVLERLPEPIDKAKKNR